MRLVFIAFVAFCVVMITLPAMASGDCKGRSCNDVGSSTVNTTTTEVTVGGTSVGAMTGGDTSVSTGGNKTYAFAYGMGDVDINEGQNCMGSEQWGTVIVGRQTMELNPWCAALFYELNGKHNFAAKMRCDIKEVRKKYQTDEECWTDQDLTNALVARSEQEDNISYVQREEEEKFHVEQQAVTYELQQQIDQLQQQLQRQPAGESDFARRAAKAKAILEGDEE